MILHRGSQRDRADMVALRQAEAVRLRIRGLSITEIAEELHITVPSAWMAVEKGLDDAAREFQENLPRYRALELRRLDGLIAGHWAEAVGDNGEPNERSAAVVIKCVMERSRLLGLYQETRDPSRTIAITEIHALLAERQRTALARARAAGIEIDVPFPEVIEVESNGNGEEKPDG